jgi:hypothetical protein
MKITVASLFALGKPNGECLEWQPARDRSGYGVLRDSATGKTTTAHRAMYQAWNGVMLATDEDVCHSCDNPPCFLPGHLWPGDAPANARDMFLKCRNRGSGQKLTPDDVRDIRARYVPGVNSMVLAAEFGVGRHAISNIGSGRTWGWLA